MSSYDLRTLDVHDDSPENRGRLLAWLQAAYQGFHQPRAAERSQELWLQHVRADDHRLSGVWRDADAFGAGPTPVATYTSWHGTVHVGGGLIPARLVSDVTVSPAHRRQGLLRSMLVADLDAAVADDVPLCVLTVSEGGIYGRFGFGPAVWRSTVEVDAARFRPLPGAGTEAGRMELVDPRTSGDLFTDLFDRWHETHRGSVERPAQYRFLVTGEWDFDAQGIDDKLRGAVHLDGDEQPDGYVLWQHSGWDTPHTARVRDLVGGDPQVELELWRFLASMDLTDRVTGSLGLASPLPWELTDPRAVKVTGSHDALWVRVLDVPAALSARPWYADGEVVLEVADELGHAAGRWRLAVTDGCAVVDPLTGGAADGTVGEALSLDVAVLGSLYLGGVDVRTLADAGRITGPASALSTLARLTDGGPAPVCRTAF